MVWCCSGKRPHSFYSPIPNTLHYFVRMQINFGDLLRRFANLEMAQTNSTWVKFTDHYMVLLFLDSPCSTYVHLFNLFQSLSISWMGNFKILCYSRMATRPNWSHIHISWTEAQNFFRTNQDLRSTHNTMHTFYVELVSKPFWKEEMVKKCIFVP